jgi:hypothetical protein
MILFCDIDGTIVDNFHRRHYVTDLMWKDWDKFYSDEETKLDRPILLAQAVLPLLMGRVSSYYFLTGRPERCRAITNWQLAEHFKLAVPPNRLLMRGDTDHRKGTVYKEEQVKSHLLSDEHGLFIDDDDRNSEVYSRYGVFLKAPECWSVFR